MPTVSIEITEAQQKALEYVAVSVQDWVDNATTDRARIAIDEIVSLYTARALDEGVAIPATREQIITDAYARGWIDTAANRVASSSNGEG